MRCARCGRRITNRNRATVQQAYNLLYSPLRSFDIKITDREVVVDICRFCSDEILRSFGFKKKKRRRIPDDG